MRVLGTAGVQHVYAAHGGQCASDSGPSTLGRPLRAGAASQLGVSRMRSRVRRLRAAAAVAPGRANRGRGPAAARAEWRQRCQVNPARRNGTKLPWHAAGVHAIAVGAVQSVRSWRRRAARSIKHALGTSAAAKVWRASTAQAVGGRASAEGVRTGSRQGAASALEREPMQSCCCGTMDGLGGGGAGAGRREGSFWGGKLHGRPRAGAREGCWAGLGLHCAASVGIEAAVATGAVVRSTREKARVAAEHCRASPRSLHRPYPTAGLSISTGAPNHHARINAPDLSAPAALAADCPPAPIHASLTRDCARHTAHRQAGYWS